MWNTKKQFNLALCTNYKQLQWKCKAILNRTSRNIQRKIIKSVNIELHKLLQQRKLIKTKISETFSQDKQRIIRINIKCRIQIIEKKQTNLVITEKKEGDNVCIEKNNNSNKRNRRFSGKHQIEKKRRKMKKQ